MTVATASPAGRAAAPATPANRIAVFAATVWESRAVRAAFPAGVERIHHGRRVFVGSAGSVEFWLILTGIGPDKAGQVAAWWLTHQAFGLVVSTGFACALVPTAIGTLLVGRAVKDFPMAGSEAVRSMRSMEGPRHAFAEFVIEAAPPDLHGPFVSLGHIVLRADDKRRYARMTDAVGLDMESAALAMAAQRADVPFIILRTVSDLLEEDLPLDFNVFLRPTGWLRGVPSVLLRPWCWPGVRRLHRQSRLAAEQLTRIFCAYRCAAAPDTSSSTPEQT